MDSNPISEHVTSLFIYCVTSFTCYTVYIVFADACHIVPYQEINYSFHGLVVAYFNILSSLSFLNIFLLFGI